MKLRYDIKHAAPYYHGVSEDVSRQHALAAMSGGHWLRSDGHDYANERLSQTEAAVAASGATRFIEGAFYSVVEVSAL